MRNPFRRRWSDQQLATMLTGYFVAGGLHQWPAVSRDLSIVLGESTGWFGDDMQLAMEFGVHSLALATIGVSEMRWFGRERRIARLASDAFPDPPPSADHEPIGPLYRACRAAAVADGRRGRAVVERLAEHFVEHIESCYDPDDLPRGLKSPAARGVIERALVDLTWCWRLELAADGLAEAERLERADAEHDRENAGATAKLS
jgi:hypothetical protein